MNNDKVVKPSVVTKLNDSADMKDEGNTEESEDRCEEQQVTRRPRRREAEKEDLKIKQYHWKFWIYWCFCIYDIVSSLVGECSVSFNVTTALSHVSLRYFVDLDFLYHYEIRR